jgi:kinesin family protein 15
LEESLPVREDASRGVYVEGLAGREVGSTLEALDVLRCGMDNRRVAATNMNRVSSRSHAVFVLTVKSEITSSDGISKVRVSKFTLVDLAGEQTLS